MAMRATIKKFYPSTIKHSLCLPKKQNFQLVVPKLRGHGNVFNVQIFLINHHFSTLNSLLTTLHLYISFFNFVLKAQFVKAYRNKAQLSKLTGTKHNYQSL